MKPIRFHPEADSEMVDAAVWYESQQKGLGKRFVTAVQDALNRIQLNPELYTLVEGDVRRCPTKTFPFGVLFRIKPDLIVIMATRNPTECACYVKNYYSYGWSLCQKTG